MTKRYRCGIATVLLPAVQLVLSSCGLSRSSARCDIINCVVDLQLPRITDGLEPAWFAGRTFAVVMISFVIGKDGRAANLVAKSPTPELANFTSKYIAQSTFSKQCAGTRGELRFELSIVQPPVAADLPAISLRAENTIRMVFAARGPSPPLRLVVPE